MTIDVNTAFANERAEQLQQARDHQADIDNRVADGKLVPIGANRFRINDPGSWDNGETLLMQGGRLTPQHGLDITDTGDVALYTAVPAWHGLGRVIPGGISSIDRVLDLGGIGWGVEKVADQYTWRGELRTKPNSFITVRCDTGDALGNVGRVYEVIQNRDLFVFLEDLVATSGGVVWESAGATRGGRRVFVSMRVPEAITIDRGGLDDEIILYIVVINSHDGQSPASVVVTPWRPVCQNTERFAVRDAVYRWTVRHTSGALTRMDEARRALGLTTKFADAFAAEETALARTDLAIAEFHKVIGDLWEPATTEDSIRARNNDTRRREHLHVMFRAEVERAGRTAYAAERAITDYLDHVAPKRPGRTLTEELGSDRALDVARATALVEGTDDDLKTRAHRRLMTLVRR